MRLNFAKISYLYLKLEHKKPLILSGLILDEKILKKK
jgi:hypothetical protein